MNKKLVINIFTIILILISLFWLTLIDWNNFLSKTNSGAILGVLAPLIVIIALQSKNKQSNNNS